MKLEGYKPGGKKRALPFDEIVFLELQVDGLTLLEERLCYLPGHIFNIRNGQTVCESG